MSVPTPAAVPASARLPASLPDDPVVLKRMIEELLGSLPQARRDNETLRHRLDGLLRRL